MISYINNMKRETLPGGTAVYTGAGLPITTDALLLARFCPAKPQWSLCDLGSGSGILLLSLIDRGLGGRAVGVEQDPHAVKLLEMAIEENGLSGRASAVCADLTAYQNPHPFDLVVANPPYFSGGLTARDPKRAAARHQLQCSIGDVCATAHRLLKDGGRLCLCWPATDFFTLLGSLGENGLEPKRLQWVRRHPNDNARLSLVEAHRGAGRGLQVLPDCILPPGETIHY